ncbi:unnamed protein product, partial [marine sediment metagenome]
MKSLEKMKNHSKRETLSVMKKNGCDSDTAEKALVAMVDYITIMPVDVDPAGIVRKLEHILDIRDAKFLNDVKKVLPNIEDAKAMNIEGLVEITSALNQVYKLVRHFYLLGKKSGSVYLIIQLQMILSLVMMEAKAYLSAIYAFAEGLPIGDGVGALVATRIAEGSKSNMICKDTSVNKVDLDGREAYVIKATGPGSNVGKTGEGI